MSLTLGDSVPAWLSAQGTAFTYEGFVQDWTLSPLQTSSAEGCVSLTLGDSVPAWPSAQPRALPSLVMAESWIGLSSPLQTSSAEGCVSYDTGGLCPGLALSLGHCLCLRRPSPGMDLIHSELPQAHAWKPARISDPPGCRTPCPCTTPRASLLTLPKSPGHVHRLGVLSSSSAEE